MKVECGFELFFIHSDPEDGWIGLKLRWGKKEALAFSKSIS